MTVIPALDESFTQWSEPPSARAGRPLLVLLHGYGSHEADLAALVPQLPGEFMFASVRAPLSLPWPSPGHSWYPIEDLETRRPDDVTSAAGRVIEWLDEVAKDAPSVGLLGFSQGASVALQTLRVAPDRIDFVVNLSGYAAPGDLPLDAQLARETPPVFWGRGTADEVIPEFLVTHTTQWLPRHSELSGRVYQGLTHSVSAQELDDVRIFLQKRLDAEPSLAPVTDIR